mgnify:CR=1 FL=1
MRQKSFDVFKVFFHALLSKFKYFFGQTVQEDHDNLDALRTLLASQGAQLRVIRIETIDFGDRTRTVLLELSPEVT